jgi:hypothetical protein
VDVPAYETMEGQGLLKKLPQLTGTLGFDSGSTAETGRRSQIQRLTGWWTASWTQSMGPWWTRLINRRGTRSRSFITDRTAVVAYTRGTAAVSPEKKMARGGALPA